MELLQTGERTKQYNIDFNNLFSVMDRITSEYQQGNRRMEQSSDKSILTGIFKTFSPRIRENTLLTAHRTPSRTDQVLVHTENINKLDIIEITGKKIMSKPNETKLESMRRNF